MKHGDRIFNEYGTSNKKVRWVDNPEWFARWKDGQTGMPLVDANMREIKETGKSSLRSGGKKQQHACWLGQTSTE